MTNNTPMNHPSCLLYIFILFSVLTAGCSVVVSEKYGEPTPEPLLPTPTIVPKCVKCLAGTFADKTSEFCGGQCSPGECSELSYCTKCLPGSEAPVDGCAECEPCDHGKIAPFPGTKTCSLCTPGTRWMNLTYCKQCERGFGNKAGQDTCFPCAPGTFSSIWDPHMPPLPEDLSSCLSCSPGSYSTKKESTNCTPCGTGKYGTSFKSSSVENCRGCPAGYYCPNLISSDPLPCTENHYCPAGSQWPIICAPLHESAAGATICTPSTLFITLVVTVALVIVISGYMAYRTAKKKKQTWADNGDLIYSDNSVLNAVATSQYGGQNARHSPRSGKPPRKSRRRKREDAQSESQFKRLLENDKSKSDEYVDPFRIPRSPGRPSPRQKSSDADQKWEASGRKRIGESTMSNSNSEIKDNVHSSDAIAIPPRSDSKLVHPPPLPPDLASLSSSLDAKNGTMGVNGNEPVYEGW